MVDDLRDLLLASGFGQVEFPVQVSLDTTIMK